MVDRDEFVAKFKLKLDKWNAEIDYLEERAERAGSKLKDESRQLIGELRGKRDEIDRRLHQLGGTVSDAGKDLREGLEEAGGDLRAAIIDAKNRFTHKEAD